MRQIKEFVTFDNGFFSTLNSVNPPLYNELFGDIKPSTLDTDLIVSYGERYAAPLLIHYDLPKVVDYVITRYADSWKRVKAALSAEYDVLNPYDTTKVTTQEKTQETTTTGKVTDTTGVTTFDSETAVDKQIDSTDNTGNTTGKETIKVTVENKGNTVNPVTNLITNEIEVRKNSYISIVVGDVGNQISLDIY